MADYSSLNQEDLASIGAIYGLSDLTVEKLHGGAANSSFKMVSDGDAYVLTILDNHDRRSAQSLARITDAVFQAGVPTSEVVRDPQGDATPMLRGQPLILKRWINGSVIDPLPTEHLRAAGCALAHLHMIDGSGLDLPIGTRRLNLEHHALIQEFQDREFATWLQEQLAKVESISSDSPPVIAHGDLFADNLVVRPDGSLSILDWETASMDDPLLDLGMSLVGLARIDGDVDMKRVKELVEGYTSTRRLDASAIAMIPIMVVHAALIIAFHRYYRHNIRFPDAERARIYLEMIGFVQSVQEASWALS
jgi:homoserine kinase type II